jgi:RNA methyltransferase, TrmH family
MNLFEREPISSPHNIRIKSAAKLRSKHERDRTGSMLIEGVRELWHALEGGIAIEEVFCCPDLLDQENSAPVMRGIEERGISLTTVGRRAFEKLAYREAGGGIVAVARQPSVTLADLPGIDRPLYLVVDAVEKPGNLGAVMRSADGAGATAVIITDPVTDLYNPNAIRSSLGTVFTMPNAMVETSLAIRWFKARKVAIITTSPTAKTFYTEADFTGPSAIVVGSEDKGLGSAWLEASDRSVRIPMKGAADSLNVSVTAAILLYEALRQREKR